jgi:hypothetical protein
MRVATQGTKTLELEYLNLQYLHYEYIVTKVSLLSLSLDISIDMKKSSVPGQLSGVPSTFGFSLLPRSLPLGKERLVDVVSISFLSQLNCCFHK